MANKFKPSATVIPVKQSVGTILAHDLTEIRPGQFKGSAFKKSHIITEEDEDVLHLKRVGKDHLYVLYLEPREVYEDDAAIRLGSAPAPGIFKEMLSIGTHVEEGEISSMRGIHLSQRPFPGCCADFSMTEYPWREV